MAKNTGILNKSRYYVDLKTLKQLYYCHLSIHKLRVNELGKYLHHPSYYNPHRSNKCIRNIFFAHKKAYLNLLGILNVDNVFKFKVAIFTLVPSAFTNSTSTASTHHSYNTRFAANQNFSRPKARTNYGKHTFLFSSYQIWETIDLDIKQSSSVFIFKFRYKQKLLLSQM